MSLHSASITSKYQLPWLILLAGILFSLFLQLQIPGEVFFSGDGGLKLLLTKQFAAGNFNVNLDLPVESWVRHLWASGLYPFEAPFAYKIAERYYIQYPFPFPLISAPFYALFGWRGLYIIPLVSIWIIWWRFYVVCQQWRLGVTSTSLGLATLIFASPLTLYGAMFWEHAIAVALAFWGLSIILLPSDRELSKNQAILSGTLIGLSVWFRQELIILVGVIFVLFFAAPLLHLSFHKKRWILISIFLTVALFLGINTITYNHPLGIYSFSLGLKSVSSGDNYSGEGQSVSTVGRIARIVMVFVKLNGRLFLYFPITALPILYGFVLSHARNIQFKQNLIFLFAIWLAIALAIPAIGWEGGKEWSPRYLLILIPPIALIATIALTSLSKSRNERLGKVSLLIFILCLGSGAYVNTCLGTIHLSRDYHHRVLPALNFLQAAQSKVVAVSSQHIAQELAASFNEKVLFLTETNDDLKQLFSVLQSQGYQQFIYIIMQDYQEKIDSLQLTSSNKYSAVKFSQLGKFGTFIFYKISIEPLSK